MRPIVLVLATLLLALPVRAQETLIILDVSNSMLGQVDGRSKLWTARTVMEALTAAVPPRTRMGLMAFGHRRPGDCEDVEVLVSPGPVSARVFARLANPLVPRGRTAIANALQEAARSVPRVLLITDGGENCAPDPCAEVRAVKASRPGFVAHIFGLDVVDPKDAADLRCMAEATGGRYFSAPSMPALAAAIAEVAGTPPLAITPTGPPVRPAPPGTQTLLSMEASELPGGSPVPVDSWNLIALGTERSGVPDAAQRRSVMTDNRTIQPQIRLDPGRYEVRLAVGNARIVERFDVEGERMQHRVVLQLGTLRPIGALAAGRPSRLGTWTIFADEVPGYQTGEQVMLLEGLEPMLRLTQGSYRLQFREGEASAEAIAFLEAGQLVSARVNLAAADITLLPSRGGRPIVAQAAEIRRAGEEAAMATSTAVRPRFVLPAGQYLARVRVEGSWRELPLALTAGQQLEIPIPLP
jgi:Ca-activated chloride channel family protein